jgi:hypothetical protein
MKILAFNDFQVFFNSTNRSVEIFTLSQVPEIQTLTFIFIFVTVCDISVIIYIYNF